MFKKPAPKLSTQMLEEASSWFIDFQEESVDQAGRAQFNAWLRRSPEHVRAFLEISTMWEEADALRQRRVDVQALIERALREHTVIGLDRRPFGAPLGALSTRAEESTHEHVTPDMSEETPQERSAHAVPGVRQLTADQPARGRQIWWA